MRICRSKLFQVSIVVAVFANTSAEARECALTGDYNLKPVWHLPEHQNSGDFDTGDYEHQVIGTVSIKCDEYEYEVPSGEVFNGFSIPRAAWSWFNTTPLAGKVQRPGIIHDHQVSEVVETSDFVHRLLFDALIAEGVDPQMAAKFYAAVLSFGPQWSAPGGDVTIPSFKKGAWDYLTFSIDSNTITQKTQVGFALSVEPEMFDQDNLAETVQSLSKQTQSFSVLELNQIESQVKLLQAAPDGTTATDQFFMDRTIFEKRNILDNLERFDIAPDRL